MNVLGDSYGAAIISRFCKKQLAQVANFTFRFQSLMALSYRLINFIRFTLYVCETIPDIELNNEPVFQVSFAEAVAETEIDTNNGRGGDGVAAASDPGTTDTNTRLVMSSEDDSECQRSSPVGDTTLVAVVLGTSGAAVAAVGSGAEHALPHIGSAAVISLKACLLSYN